MRLSAGSVATFHNVLPPEKPGEGVTSMSNTELTTIEPILEINPLPQTDLVHQPAPQPDPQPVQPAAQRKPYLCRHIFVDGRRCGSRALRGQPFCYYHYAHRVPVLANRRRREPSYGFELTPLDGLDNHTSIQLSLAEVLSRVASNSIDPKRAWLLIYGLQIAAKNLRHAKAANAIDEAPIAEGIVEDAAHGQLAELEEGRPAPPSLVERMCAILRANPDADLTDPDVLEVQTYPLQIETLGPEDTGTPHPAYEKISYGKDRKQDRSEDRNQISRAAPGQIPREACGSSESRSSTGEGRHASTHTHAASGTQASPPHHGPQPQAAEAAGAARQDRPRQQRSQAAPRSLSPGLQGQDQLRRQEDQLPAQGRISALFASAPSRPLRPLRKHRAHRVPLCRCLSSANLCALRDRCVCLVPLSHP